MYTSSTCVQICSVFDKCNLIFGYCETILATFLVKYAKSKTEH